MEKETTILYPSKIQIATKRAAVYVRCSSDEVRKGRTDDKDKSEEAKRGYSPETQEEKIKSFAKNEGWEINEGSLYKDIGFSGGTEKRPDLQRLLKDARNKKIDVIIVYRMDRFFRNLRLLLNTVAELRDIIAGLELEATALRANHASVPYPIEGRLPKDKDKLTAMLDRLLNSYILDGSGPGRTPLFM